MFPRGCFQFPSARWLWALLPCETTRQASFAGELRGGGRGGGGSQTTGVLRFLNARHSGTVLIFLFLLSREDFLASCADVPRGRGPVVTSPLPSFAPSRPHDEAFPPRPTCVAVSSTSVNAGCSHLRYVIPTFLRTRVAPIPVFFLNVYLLLDASA